MIARELESLQKEFLLGLNQMVEPLIRAGFGSPLLWPTGTIVVETTGRKTGRQINIPVLATRLGELVVFSTVRRRAQWVKNLAAKPEVRYWLAGRPHAATAYVFTPDGATAPADDLPPQVACLARVLQQQSQLLGVSFAVLIPQAS